MRYIERLRAVATIGVISFLVASCTTSTKIRDDVLGLAPSVPLLEVPDDVIRQEIEKAATDDNIERIQDFFDSRISHYGMPILLDSNLKVLAYANHLLVGLSFLDFFGNNRERIRSAFSRTGRTVTLKSEYKGQDATCILYIEYLESTSMYFLILGLEGGYR